MKTKLFKKIFFVLFNLFLIISCDDLQEDIDKVESERDALLEKQDSLNSLINNFENGKTIENVLNLIYVSDGKFNNWNHQYENGRLSVSYYSELNYSIKTYYRVDNSNKFYFFEHSYENGQIVKSSSDEISLNWIWENDTLIKVETEKNNKLSSTILLSDGLITEKKYYYENKIAQKLFYKYNSLNLLVEVKDSLGSKLQQFEYNSQNKLEKASIFINNTIQYLYEFVYNNNQLETYIEKNYKVSTYQKYSLYNQDGYEVQKTEKLDMITDSVVEAKINYFKNGLLMRTERLAPGFKEKIERGYDEHNKLSLFIKESFYKNSNNEFYLISYIKDSLYIVDNFYNSIFMHLRYNEDGDLESVSKKTRFLDIETYKNSPISISDVSNFKKSDVKQIKVLEYKYIDGVEVFDDHNYYKYEFKHGGILKYRDSTVSYFDEERIKTKTIITEYFDVWPFSPKKKSVVTYDENNQSTVVFYSRQLNSIDESEAWLVE
jgi:hypothetical protein